MRFLSLRLKAKGVILAWFTEEADEIVYGAEAEPFRYLSIGKRCRCQQTRGFFKLAFRNVLDGGHSELRTEKLKEPTWADLDSLRQFLHREHAIHIPFNAIDALHDRFAILFFAVHPLAVSGFHGARQKFKHRKRLKYLHGAALLKSQYPLHEVFRPSGSN